MRDNEVYSTNTFNMSLATLQRIDTILKDLHYYNTISHIQVVQRCLFCLYKELYPFLSDDERDEASNFWNGIKVGIMMNEFNNPIVESSLPEKMNIFEFWLRDRLHLKGLLMSKPDNPEMAISQM